jgi:hypothetical protein
MSQIRYQLRPSFRTHRTIFLWENARNPVPVGQLQSSKCETNRKRRRRLIIDFKFNGWGREPTESAAGSGTAGSLHRLRKPFSGGRKPASRWDIRVPGSTLIWARDLSHLELRYEGKRWNLKGPQPI